MFGQLTVITVFGRVLEEDEKIVMIESVHIDREHPENASSESVMNSGWQIVKSTIISRKTVGYWRHP